jgi:hypothetical protein
MYAVTGDDSIIELPEMEISVSPRGKRFDADAIEGLWREGALCVAFFVVLGCFSIFFLFYDAYFYILS